MMGPLEWEAYLQECSRRIINGPEDGTPLLSEAVLRSGWLGYEGTSSSAVRQAEARLGVKLPPSLQAFYTASNGWRTVGCFIYEVLPVEKIGWIADLADSLYKGAVALEEYYAHDRHANLSETTYGQDTGAERGYVFVSGQRLPEIGFGQGTPVKRSLVIAQDGDASTWLLDPGTVNDKGEWAGGRWSNWNPGMEWIADSFEELFRDEYDTYLRLNAKD